MKMRGDKIPTERGTGENTPFAKQSRKKEPVNGHDTIKSIIFALLKYSSKLLNFGHENGLKVNKVQHLSDGREGVEGGGGYWGLG